MIIGVPKEIKVREYRVGMTPAGVRSLTSRGHTVLVEHDAGAGSGIRDAEYTAQGGKIVPTAADAWGAELVVKVKEPLPVEHGYFRKGLLLYTYLHLANEPELTRALARSGVVGVAYETIELEDGGLPLLRPMSEVAGRMAVQVGATCLEKERGGKGVLLGGVPGTRRGRVGILGGGVVGRNAATIAVGMGAKVTVVDRSADALKRLASQFGTSISTVFSTRSAIEELVRRADLLIGAVLVPGAAAPKLVTHDMVRTMKPGSVIVDVAIDQGGCVETSHATTHAEPTYVVDGVVHYCVANMPGAVARTSTFALNNVTLPFAIALANNGWKKALAQDVHLRNGLIVSEGQVTCEPVAQAHGLPYVTAESAIGM